MIKGLGGTSSGKLRLYECHVSRSLADLWDCRRSRMAAGRQRRWNIGGRRSSAEDARIEAARGGSGEGLCRFTENLWIFHLKMVWYGADETTATCGIQKFRWREKIKHLSKYRGCQHRTTPAGQILGVATPAALTPMNGGMSADGILWRPCASAGQDSHSAVALQCRSACLPFSARILDIPLYSKRRWYAYTQWLSSRARHAYRSSRLKMLEWA